MAADTVPGSEMQDEGVLWGRETWGGEEVAVEKGLQVGKGAKPFVCWGRAAIRLLIALVPIRGVAQGIVICCHPCSMYCVVGVEVRYCGITHCVACSSVHQHRIAL